MKSVEYWIKAINEAEEHEEVFRLWFLAQDETPVGDPLRRTRAIEIHKGAKPRLMEAINDLNEKRDNAV